MFLAGGGASKVIYSSRTHSQLAQVVSQLKTALAASNAVGEAEEEGNRRPIRAVVLGSRDQLCVNDSVKEKAANASEKIKLCNILTKAKKCEFYNNFSKSEDGGGGGFDLGSNGVQQDDDVCDIEELVTKTKRQRVCPYFKSRDLSSSADLVFVPYNYLLDASIRSSLSIDLRGSVVILDEAHNVMKTCESTLR